jgi:cellulose synthase/poly-beta-1,6-N-acetylglucosamine synthase-like glycosyltransferase
MQGWIAFLTNGLNLFNLLILSYFFLGNGVYTLLMVLSLGWVWLHNRRLAYQSLDELRDPVQVLPVTLIMPAWNEEDTILDTVRSALETDYPSLEVIVVDDGSTDGTLSRLISTYHLLPMDLTYRPRLATRRVRGFFLNPEIPNLLVVSKVRGGKADALNVGINLCRTPYFSSLDADCVLEREALLRLMWPIFNSPAETVVSAGIIRIINGCEVENGQVVKAGLPRTRLERFQVVEYLRTFLFGRTGWDLLGGTLVISGAFAVYEREIVVETGGFQQDTVTEDLELIVRLHRWAALHGRPIKTSFTVDPVCWTECPATTEMRARQRRRWQLGLCQTLWKHREMLFNRKYGIAGLLSFPFHLYVEGLGAAVEFIGYLLIPLAIVLNLVPLHLCLLFIVLGLAYGSFLSVGAVLLEELTHRRYPRTRDLLTLLVYAVFENVGYRQLVLFYRFQGVLRFLTGFRQWEKVVHVGARVQA